MPSSRFCPVRLAPLGFSLLFALSVPALLAQERVDGAIQKHGFFQQKIAPEEIKVEHGSEFKGAHKVAISVFNVAFPSEFHYIAVTKGHSLLGDRSFSAKAHMDTTMTGVDHATQQRITDQAYALFVEQLQGAGYEVVDQAGLTQLAPEFGKWASIPNFSQGRYGTYVAPTGRSLRFLQGDTAKRDTSGVFGVQNTAFRVFDTPPAFARSPYIAHDGKIGIIAVTLVVDYGVYSSSGRSNKMGKAATVGFKPGVAIAAGNLSDSATMLEYWGPSSGGFPAGAYLQQPIRSDRAFGEVRGLGQPDEKSEVGVQDVTITADPAKFEVAANEVIALAVPKLVSVMAAAR
jgi:hypothetical protein